MLKLKSIVILTLIKRPHASGWDSQVGNGTVPIKTNIMNYTLKAQISPAEPKSMVAHREVLPAFHSGGGRMFS
jgi:hypothetical protein